MFKDLSPLQIHLIEIIVMLLGAFLIGFLTAWFVQRLRLGPKGKGLPKADAIEKANERIEELRDQLREERRKNTRK